MLKNLWLFTTNTVLKSQRGTVQCIYNVILAENRRLQLGWGSRSSLEAVMWIEKNGNSIV